MGRHEPPVRNTHLKKPEKVYVQKDGRLNQGTSLVNLGDKEQVNVQKELSPNAELEKELSEELARRNAPETLASVATEIEIEPIINQNRFQVLNNEVSEEQHALKNDENEAAVEGDVEHDASSQDS
jgi:hypothetical protein